MSKINLDKYRHIIWDWNGTLLNDVDLCNSIINKILTENDLPELSRDNYREVFTFPVKDYYVKAGIDFNKNSFEELGLQFMRHYEERKLSCEFYPFVKEVLNELDEQGKEQHLLSAYKHDTLTEIIRHFGIEKYFSSVTGLDNIYAGSKEHLGRKLIEKLAPNNGQVLLIGDTRHDYDVAKSIGADSLIITSGHQSELHFDELDVPLFNTLEEFYNSIKNKNL